MPRSLALSRLAKLRRSPGSDRATGAFSYHRLVPTSAADEEFAARQSTLRREATALLDELDRSAILTDVGPVALAGSYVSELMCWRELDVMVLVGADYSPADVLQLISRIMQFPGVIGFDYRDERGDRSPTGQVRDERYHIPFMIDRGAGIWCLDITLWLHDFTGTSLPGIRHCATRSPTSNGQPYCGSRMSGIGYRSIPIRFPA